MEGRRLLSAKCLQGRENTIWHGVCNVSSNAAIERCTKVPRRKIMTTISFSKQLVAIAATILVSTACLLGAVGPAATGQASSIVAGNTLA
jgi:hypothetical protein